jgi:TRAP-type mannitol/chloroaromatic compound transport system permease small subunit
MQWLSVNIQRLAVFMVLLGSLGMIASMFIGVADVIGTKFADYPVPGTLEFTESTMVLIVFGALAYTQFRRGHIRVELLYGHVGPAAQSFMEALTHVVAFVFFALIAWQGISELQYSWEMKEATMGTVRFPLYPARFLLIVGVAILLMRLLLDIIGDIRRMARGEPPPGAAGGTPPE